MRFAFYILSGAVQNPMHGKGERMTRWTRHNSWYLWIIYNTCWVAQMLTITRKLVTSSHSSLTVVELCVRSWCSWRTTADHIHVHWVVLKIHWSWVTESLAKMYASVVHPAVFRYWRKAWRLSVLSRRLEMIMLLRKRPCCVLATTHMLLQYIGWHYADYRSKRCSVDWSSHCHLLWLIVSKRTRTRYATHLPLERLYAGQSQ